MADHWYWNNVGVATGARAVSHCVSPLSSQSFAGIRKEDIELPSPCRTTAVLFHGMGRVDWA